MNTPRFDDWVEVVLVLAPTGADAEVAAELLQGVGARSVVCETMADVVRGLERGTAALVIASEALEHGGAEQLSDALTEQPTWSDVPVILLTLESPAIVRGPLQRLVDSVGNITLLERPFQTASFVSVVRVALRARRRQYEVRRLLLSEREARARAAWESRRADTRERELRASEERFRLIANSIPQLAWMADPHGRLFWFNERWYAFAAADPEQPKSGWRSWLAAQDPAYLPGAEQRWRFSLATGTPFDMEFPMRRFDGEYRWFLTRAVALKSPDGKPTLWFGTSTDITEHRETAQALRHSEERLLLAVETAQLGLWTLDPVRQQFRCSDAFRSQIGRDRSVTYDEFWHSVHSVDRPRLEERARDAVQAGVVLNAEYRIVRLDGEERWILARARPVFGDDGSFVQLLGVSLDITERKLGEQRRDEALAAERAARSEAERVARMKDEFLATLSHELRTPLNAVLGWAEVLLRTGPTSTDFERGMNAITRNARLQAQLIEDLLDTSRIVSGGLGLELADVDLAEVVDAAIESVQPLSGARKVQIERSFEPGVRVRGDRRRLQQIAWNLLSNAVKFSPSGSTVSVTIGLDGPQVWLEVRDWGQGIEAEFLPHLFERFRQQDSSRKRRSGGLGLGLSIVRHLVRLHGGEVTGASAGTGAGATFRVTLPVVVAANEAARLGPPAPVRHLAGDELRGALILVVDDEPDARELVGRILRESNATVVLAASAEEALATLKRDVPDLLVSDIGMPGKDGYELVQEIRQLPGRLGATPAVALTAFARAEDREMALKAGFQHHLGKPVDSIALVCVAADLLASRTASPMAARTGT